MWKNLKVNEDTHMRLFLSKREEEINQQKFISNSKYLNILLDNFKKREVKDGDRGKENKVVKYNK
jgi:hypothetical protein